MLSRVYLLNLCAVVVLSYRIMLDYVPDYYVKTLNFECKFDTQWVVNTSCILKPISWERTLTNMSADIIKPLKNVSMHFQVFRRETQYMPFLVSIRKNVCDLFRNKKVDIYSRVLIQIWKRFSNVKPICPVFGHLEFKDFFMDTKTFPPGTPTGIYKAVLTLSEGYPPQPLGCAKFYGELIEKRRVLNKNITKQA